MIKSLLFLSMLSVCYAGMEAQTARPVTISGKVTTDNDSVKLVVWFAKDPVLGYGDELQRIDAAVDTNGRFSIVTPPIVRPARMSIHDAVSRQHIFDLDQQVVAPGDTIELYINIHDKGEPYSCKIVFFGEGAAKYEAVQTLKLAGLQPVDKAKGIGSVISAYDSLYKLQQEVLLHYRNRLTNEEFNTLLTDLRGKLNNRALMKVCGYNFGSIHSPIANDASLAEKKEQFKQLVDHIDSIAAPSHEAAQSMTMTEYLYRKTRAAVVFENKDATDLLQPLYLKLCSTFKGPLLDKLLTMLLLNSMENYYFFGGIDADAYTVCLQDAYSRIKTPALKEKCKFYLDRFTKGKPAYNFILPVDSSNNRISLAQLKGKVVLLDLWSYNCTGCLQFTQRFHKSIYPQFKDNPNFAVASIMLGESNKEAYLYRLRNGGGVVYTYSDYINLFGGTGVASARAMEKYHNIDAFPTLMLLDKQGKIYSTTLPVIYGDPRNKELEKNVDKLAKLISDALAQPAAEK